MLHRNIGRSFFFIKTEKQGLFKFLAHAECFFELRDQFKVDLPGERLVKDMELFFDQSNTSKTKHTLIAMLAHEHVGTLDAMVCVGAVARLATVG